MFIAASRRDSHSVRSAMFIAASRQGAALRQECHVYSQASRREPHSVRSAMFIAKRAAGIRTPSGVPCL